MDSVTVKKIVNKGVFTSLHVAPITGEAGDVIMVGDQPYEWNEETSTWTETDPENVVILPGTGSDSHDKGTFSTIYQVHKAYPSGGGEGDYVTIQGYRHYWNASRGTWVVTQERDDYWDHQLGALSEQVGNIGALTKAMSIYFSAGYLYGGVIGPLSPIKTTVVKVMYIAYDAGVYHNCGDIIVEEGTTAILCWDGLAWHKETLLFAKATDLKALMTKVEDIQKELKDILHCKEDDLDTEEYEDF